MTVGGEGWRFEDFRRIASAGSESEDSHRGMIDVGEDPHRRGGQGAVPLSREVVGISWVGLIRYLSEGG